MNDRTTNDRTIDEDTWSRAFGRVLRGAGNLALTGASYAVQGLTLSYLWGLFVVPLGAMELSVAHAAGLIVLCNMFLINQTMTIISLIRPKSTDDHVPVWMQNLVMIFIACPIAAATGWIIVSLGGVPLP